MQTYTDLEIILVDDGSTDACPGICDEYAVADARIRVIHKENGGLSSARNAGIEIATGEFVGFVDSDDFVQPAMYEILYQACRDYEVAIAMCGRRVIDENDKMIRYECCMEHAALMDAKEAVKSLLLNDNKCDSAACDKLYRKSLFSNIRYPEKVHYEDQNVTARLYYYAGRIFHVGQALYTYRKRKGSITSSSFNGRSIDEVKQAELLKEFIDEKYPEFKKDSMYFVCYKLSFPLFLAYSCRDNKMKEQMKEVCDYSHRYFPGVMHGSFSIKHKIWCLRNYIVLRLRLRYWR